MMKYKVVRVFRDFVMFQNEVRMAIAEGWEPIGGVSSDEGNLYQAMIKKPIGEKNKG